MNKLKPNPVAALTMQMEKNGYKSKVLNEYTKHVDLASVKELSQKFSSICPWYDEVIQNKRCFLKDCLNKQFSNSKEEHLILILAAGKSPLSLQILADHYDKVNKIIEIDSVSMDDKKELYDVHFPQLTNKIKCITANYTSKSVLSILNNIIQDYYHRQPCIILIEGVSYYFSIEDIKNIINSFKSDQKHNTLLMDYLLPSQFLAEDRKSISGNIKKTIKSFTGLKNVTSLTSKQLKPIVDHAGGSLIEVASLKDMEKQRTGNNKYFNQNEDSWLEYSVWQI